MHWVPDRTGRFLWRPYFQPEELDALCEQRIRRFLRDRHGHVAYPVSTDDLTLLIEQEAGDLDLGADLSDLSHHGVEVQGITSFYSDKPPRVRIARTLSLDARRQARLRTTLAHELGHVLLHDFARRLSERDESMPDRTLDDAQPAVCRAATLIQPLGTDWMEWQAAYACGALLMPRTAVDEFVDAVVREPGAAQDRPGLGTLIDRVRSQFLVSELAAYVRLRQLRHIGARGSERMTPQVGNAGSRFYVQEPPPHLETLVVQQIVRLARARNRPHAD